MKKILFVLVLSTVFSSCRVFPIYTENAYYLDFSKYQTDGFTVYASEFVNFDYVNTGIIEVTVYDGMIRSDGKPVESSYKEGSKEYEEFAKSSLIKTATIDDAFKRLKDECVKKGANGVIGVRIEEIKAKEPSDETRFGNVIGYRMTGIAIKK